MTEDQIDGLIADLNASADEALKKEKEEMQPQAPMGYAGASAINAKLAVDRPATELEVFISRLNGLFQDMADMNSRLYAVNNNVFGPAPPRNSVSEKPASYPEGAPKTVLLGYAIDRIRETANNLSEEISRIEGL